MIPWQIAVGGFFYALLIGCAFRANRRMTIREEGPGAPAIMDLFLALVWPANAIVIGIAVCIADAEFDGYQHKKANS
jgi:hypothetical protein